MNETNETVSAKREDETVKLQDGRQLRLNEDPGYRPDGGPILQILYTSGQFEGGWVVPDGPGDRAIWNTLLAQSREIEQLRGIVADLLYYPEWFIQEIEDHVQKHGLKGTVSGASYRHSVETARGVLDAATAALAGFSTVAAPQWVKVEDGVPDFKVPVEAAFTFLLTGERRRAYLVRLDCGDFCMENDTDWFAFNHRWLPFDMSEMPDLRPFVNCSVTHWRYLAPEPCTAPIAPMEGQGEKDG